MAPACNSGFAVQKAIPLCPAAKKVNLSGLVGQKANPPCPPFSKGGILKSRFSKVGYLQQAGCLQESRSDLPNNRCTPTRIIPSKEGIHNLPLKNNYLSIPPLKKGGRGDLPFSQRSREDSLLPNERTARH